MDDRRRPSPDSWDSRRTRDALAVVETRIELLQRGWIAYSGFPGHFYEQEFRRSLNWYSYHSACVYTCLRIIAAIKLLLYSALNVAYNIGPRKYTSCVPRNYPAYVKLLYLRGQSGTVCSFVECVCRIFKCKKESVQWSASSVGVLHLVSQRMRHTDRWNRNVIHIIHRMQ